MILLFDMCLLTNLFLYPLYIELKRKGKEIYYWKDPKHREVDFVIKEGMAVKELIRVCFN